MAKEIYARFIMLYTKNYKYDRHGEKSLIMPWSIFLITILMIPINGTNYLQILYAAFAYMVIMVRKIDKTEQDDNINIYSKYFFTFIIISAVVGLLSGVSFKTQISDILTSSLPYMCMIIGSYYAVRFKEKKQVKLLAFLIIVEFLIGLGQNFSTGFRNYIFNLYDTESRLLSYEVEDVGRAVGTLRSPNYYGIVCVILGLVFIGFLFDSEARKKRINVFFNICISFLVLAIVVFSVSKTCIICIACVFVFCVLYSSSMNTTVKTFLVLVCIIVTVFILIPKFEEYSNRTIDLTTMSGRTDNWSEIIKLGFSGKFERIFFGYGNGYSIFSNLGIYADSYYIILLFEQGIVGVAAYFITWFSIGMNTLKRRPSIYRTYTLSLICIMLLSDVTAAVTDMPIVCIVLYYMIGRYSKLSMLKDNSMQQKEV